MRVGILIVLLCLATAAAAAAKLPQDRIAFWKGVAQCETGSRWDWGAKHRHLEGSAYEGGVGFAASTWRLWAGQLDILTQYPHAYNAPMLVQMRVAEYGLSKGGFWGCLHR